MGAMLCPSCRKLISDDEPRCPYCGTLRPGLWGFGPMLQRFFGHRLELVPLITIVCVGLYVVSLLLDLRAALDPGGFPFGILSPGHEVLILLGMTGKRLVALGHWWTLLTAIYLHGGILHIFFNVLWIRQLGRFAEEELGPARFFVLFSVSGAGGFLLSNVLSNAPSIGASGSVFGLLGAMIAFRRRRGGAGDVVTQQFISWAVLLFALGLFMRGVNNWAHLGGFACGYLFGQRIHGARERPEGRRMQLLALGLLALTVFGFVASIVTILPEFLEVRGR